MTGACVLQTFFLTLQAEAEIDPSRPEQAGALLDRALHAVTTTGERFYEPRSIAFWEKWRSGRATPTRRQAITSGPVKSPASWA